jgi:TonB-linked SusC/RagA family outer membrane protein
MQKHASPAQATLGRRALCDRPTFGGNRFLTTSTEGRRGHTAKLPDVVTKTFRVMRLTALLITVAIANVSAKGLSQTITFSGKDVPLQTIFRQIESQSAYFIFYSQSALSKAKKVSIEANNEKLTSFLDRIFTDQPLTYTIKGRNIIVMAAAGLSPQLYDSPSLNSPPITIRGRIVNEKGEPVVASVLVKGTNIGTTATGDGDFELNNVDENAVLLISGVSIETLEIPVNRRSSISITAKTKISAEQEVTVSTGYWSTTKQRSTGNIAKVSAKEIEKQPVTNPLMALQGRMAGVDITPNTGAPGAAVNIQIRGQNSLRFDGSYPLYIIDGVPVDSRALRSGSTELFELGFDPLSTLNPANIESIEVLKDGAATSIYGSRGANGVVRITMKKANATDRTHFDLNLYSGIGQLAHKINLLNTEQYLEMRREALANDGTTPSGYDYDLNGTWDSTRYTDWQETLLGGNANVTDVQTGVSGGNRNISYRLTAGFHKENAIYPGNFGFHSITGNFSLNHTSTNKKFNTTLSMNYGSTKGKYFNTSDYVQYAIITPPNAPPLYDENGELNWQIAYPLGPASPQSSWVNPLSVLKKTHEATNGAWVANGTLSYELVAGLSLKANLGFTDMNYDEILKTPLAALGPDQHGPAYTGTATFGINKRKSWIIEPQVTYYKNFAHHNIEIVLGTSLQGSENKYQSVTGSGYTSDVLLNSIQGAVTQIFNADEEIQYRYSAFFGRIGYNWKSRYLVDITGRRDGSSRFGPGNRFGNFAGAGIAWVLSQEKFFSDNLAFISFGKIRASYATTGNDQIPDYGFIDTYSITRNMYQRQVSLYPSALFNPDYGWELTRKAEIAMELAFLNNRISLEASAYRNRSSNQLVNYPLPSATGFDFILSNFIAAVQNRGWEFVVSTKNIERSAFKWVTTLNLTIPQNKLIEFDNIENSPYATQYRVGKPLNIRRTYKWLGVNPESGLHEIFDANKDGVYNDSDKDFSKAVGKKYYGGLLNSISFRRFEMSFLLQFASQNAQFRYSAPGGRQNQFVEIMKRWQSKGDISDHQKFTDATSGQRVYEYAMGSDYAIVDASFIRLKTVSLSYALPGRMLNSIKIQNVSAFVQMQNVFTITDFVALDPETGSYTLPQLRMITTGLQFKL